MSKYLRDGSLQYLTITEKELDVINNKLIQILEDNNKKISPLQNIQDKKIMSEGIFRVTYILRADGKGVRYFDYSEMKKEFTQANRIERLIIIMNTELNINTQHSLGKRIELHLNSTNDNSSYLIEDDDNVWVEGVTQEINAILNKFKNKNYIYYSWWFIALIQLIGVVGVFLFCLWLSSKIAPLLKIDNSPLFTFIGVFLLLSNFWTFIIFVIKSFIEKNYPQIEFRRKRSLHWLLQTIIGGLVIYLFKVILSYIKGIYVR